MNWKIFRQLLNEQRAALEVWEKAIADVGEDDAPLWITCALVGANQESVASVIISLVKQGRRLEQEKERLLAAMVD